MKPKLQNFLGKRVGSHKILADAFEIGIMSDGQVTHKNSVD